MAGREERELDKCLKLLTDCKMDGEVLNRVTDNKIIPLSDFLPIPVNEVVYDDGRTIERSFLIKGIKRVGGKIILLPAVMVTAASLPAMTWVLENWGFAANISAPIHTKKDHLRGIICTLGSKIAQKRTVYTHTGWRKIGGKYCFLYHSGAIGNNKVSVELDYKLQPYNMGCKGVSFEKATLAFLRLFEISSEKVMFPLIAIAFLSPLNEFLRQVGYEPAFLLYLLGRTQTKKSTIAALILSFFGRFTSSTLPSSFKDTENAIEKKGHSLKDVPTVIDDFHPVSHYKEKQNMDKIAQSLSRGYGDRAGKDRMQADTSIRQGFAPRGNAIITGEDFPAIGQSGSARNFIVELLANDVPASDDLDFVQEQASMGVLAKFMEQYILWLIPQATSLPVQLKGKFLELRHRAIKEKIVGFGRTGDIVAWLQIGMESMIDFCISQKIYTKDIGENKKEEAWNVFCGLSCVQLEKAEEDKPNNMFIDAIKEMLESGRVYVKNYPEDTEREYNRKSEILGYLENDKYYFFPTQTFSCVVQFYKQQSVDFPLSRTRLFKQMADEKLIETETTGTTKTYTKQKRFGKEKNRYLVMDREIFYPQETQTD